MTAESAAEEGLMESASDDDVSLRMENGTDFVITSAQAKRIDEDGYSRDLLSAGLGWNPGGFIDVEFEKDASVRKDLSEEPDAVNASWTEEGVYVTSPLYDLRFTCEDGTVLDIRMVDLDELMRAQDIAIKYDEASGLAYIEHQRDGQTVSTLESARYMADAAAAVAQAQAEE